MRALALVESFRGALEARGGRSATVLLEEPAPEPLGGAWATLEALYTRCARHGTRLDIEDLERIRVRRDALSHGQVMTDAAVEAALVGSRLRAEGTREIADAAEHAAVRAALAGSRAAYQSRVRAAFMEQLPAEGVARDQWERALLEEMRGAPRAAQLRALVLLTVLAHMYANTAVYSDQSDEKEAPPAALMRAWKAVARWTKSAAPHQPAGSIYEISELNVRRAVQDGGTHEAFLDGLLAVLRGSISQRTLTQEAVERVDLLFPFIQEQQPDGSWASDKLERTTWNLIYLMSLVGDQGVRPVFAWLAEHGAALLEWWQVRQRGATEHPVLAEAPRAALDAALEEAATWTRVMGSLFGLLNKGNAHTPAHWFRFVRHWPDWNIETEQQGELVPGFNGGQLQALHALDDLFLRGRRSQIAVEMAYQEKFLPDADHRQLTSLQQMMTELAIPWRAYAELSSETTGRFNSVVWEILSFRVSHTTYAWRVLQEGENPSTGGMFEDASQKGERAVGGRRDSLGPESPQHLHFLNAMVPRLLESSGGLIRDGSVEGRYWHWSVGLGQNGPSATDPHRRIQAFARPVWEQRRAVEEQRSAFRHTSTSDAHAELGTQHMGADEWLAHLVRYDPRWTANIERGVAGSPSEIVERALLLRRVEVFSLLNEVVLAEIAPWLEERSLEAGERLFEEGDAGDEMYIIADGCLRIERGGLPLVDRGPMEIVGELAVLDVAPRSAGARALEPTRLLILKGEHLYRLMEEHPEIVRGILRVLCRRLR